MKLGWILFFLFYFSTIVQSSAQPDFSVQYPLDSVMIYRDYKDSTHYYYHASNLYIAEEISGKPSFSFVQTRYTGSQRSGDQGYFRHRSFVQIKVRQTIPGNKLVAQIKANLRNRYNLGAVYLSPLNYKKIEAKLICPRIGEAPLVSEVAQAENEPAITQTADWQEKVFTLSLDNHTSQALWEVMQTGRSLLSIEYQMIAEGKTAMSTPDSAVFEITLSDSATKQEKMLSMTESFEASSQVFGEKVVRADAIPILIDIGKYPDLLKQVDINEQIPPEYPLLQVYCFDFQNHLSKSLLLKRVTLQAWGVNLERVQTTVTFRKTTPDKIFQTAYFKHAVLIHKPIRYKIMTIDSKNEGKESGWKAWHLYDSILDVTLKE